jgi:hypothetical protein
MNHTKSAPRAYNQTHLPRKYMPGRRRFSVYISWSYPAEANRDVTEMDNRFSTMTEVRRVLWPDYEMPQYADPSLFQQGITGSLELFFLAWILFQEIVGDITGHPVPMFQRVDQAGVMLPLDERILSDTDTLLMWGLDHMVTGQEASDEEIEAVRDFLKREGTCLILGPHHDVGASDDLTVRAMEYAHHGDPLVPRQQRFARYIRSLMKGLGIPIENRWGLLPTRDPATKQIGPLSINKDLDTHGLLNGVTTFNFHRHLPHYTPTTEDDKSIHVLARQPIDMSNPHPFTEAGNREFNTFVWMPPNGDRAGDVLFADSTIFSTLFGGTKSLTNFWRNLAQM